MRKDHIHYFCYSHIIAAAWLAIGLLCGGKKVMAQAPQLPELVQELSAPADSIAYINTLGKLGMLYMMINADSGFIYAIREQEMANRWQYKNGVADAYDILSICYALRTDFNIAALYGYKALQLYKSLSDSARMAETTNNLYLYYGCMGRPADANNYFYEAFHLASRLPPSNDSIYSLLLVNYAMRFYQDSTRQDSVQWAWRKAAQISEKYPRSRIPLYIAAFAADTLVAQGREKRRRRKLMNWPRKHWEEDYPT